MSEYAIETKELQKSFGERCAVDRISFAVEQGEIFGFLGPNGAGKTTTISLLTGQIDPSGGSAHVAGCNVATERDHLMASIGVVFEEQNVYGRLTGRRNLLFFAELHGVAQARVDEVLEQVSLTDRAHDAAREYSNGMKQRLVIARAILHKPRVLFLDEPTRGLDPAVAAGIRKLVRSLADEGTTVFLTTHYMEEADALCKRVAFLDQGSIVALDTPTRLKLSHGDRAVRVCLDDGTEELLSLGDGEDGRRLGELAASNWVVTVHSCEATLETVFLAKTGRSLGP